VLSDSAARRILYPLTAAIIFAWFFFFTGKSLSLYFDSDDMMNLYLAWSKPLAEVYRPVGALFYRGLFALGGFNPLPFRVACLAIGVVNMGLCWWFLRVVSRSERVTALALLLFAFHTRLMEVWWRNAVIYDLLCFTFFYLAVCVYVGTRKAGRTPGLAPSCAILTCFLCALGAKENALALPPVLLGYELLFHGIRWRNLRWPAALALLDIPYLYFKTHGAAAMANLAGYAPEYTARQFLGAWGRFLGYLLVRDRDLQPWVAACILTGLLAVAIAARSRTLSLAWLILFLAPLPVTFIAYRGGYVLYTAYPGAVMYAAVVLVAAQDFIARKHPQYRTALACAVFALVAWRWGKLNVHDQRVDPRPWLYESAAQVHSMAGQMRSLAPQLPKGAHLLFLRDAFSSGEWTPYFIVKLLYRDDTLVPDRIKMMDKKPADWNGYQYVFGFEQGRYQLLKP
jgi:hypothetical protein